MKLRQRISFKYFLIATTTKCCRSISVTALGQAKSEQESRMGKFLFYKMGLNERPIYRKYLEYLYLASTGEWMVS